VWPILVRAGEKPRDPVLYWNIGAKQAVMANGWKLIVSAKNAKVELYDMRDERTDLAGRNAANVAELEQLLKKERALDPAK
jgi:hypothetical protein